MKKKNPANGIYTGGKIAANAVQILKQIKECKTLIDRQRLSWDQLANRQLARVQTALGEFHKSLKQK